MDKDIITTRQSQCTHEVKIIYARRGEIAKAWFTTHIDNWLPWTKHNLTKALPTGGSANIFKVWASLIYNEHSIEFDNWRINKLKE